MALLALMATTVSALSSSGVAIAQTPGVPGAPSITSVTAGLNQLTPNWTPPVNTGTSAITDYEVRYRVGTSGEWSPFFDYSYDSGLLDDADTTWSHGQDPLDLGSPTGDLASYIERTAYNGSNGLYKVKQAVSALRFQVEGEASTLATVRLMYSSTKPTDLRWDGTELTRVDSTGDRNQISLTFQTQALPANSWFWFDGYDRTTTSDGLKLTATTISRLRWQVDVSTISATTRLATIKALTNGLSYQVQVRARNGTGWGPWSASATAVPVGPPEVPTGLQVGTGNSLLTARWSAPSNNGGRAISDYNIQYRIASSGGNWSDWQASTVSAATTTTITGLTNGTGYEVRVRAVSSAGDGPWTGSATNKAGKPSQMNIGLSAVRPRPLPPNTYDKGGLLSINLGAEANGSAIQDYDLRYRRAGTTTWYTLRDRTLDSGKLTNSEASGNDDPIDFFESSALPRRVAVTRESVGTQSTQRYGVYKFSKAVDQLWIRANGTITGGGTVVARWHTSKPTQANLATVGTQIFSVTTDSDHTFWQDGWIVDLPANAYVWLHTSGNATLTERRLQFDFTDNSTDGSMVLSGLFNGATYELQARAKNAVGWGDWASASGIPGTPMRPEVNQPTAKHQALDVTWAWPASDNGSTITGYDVRYRAGSSGAWTSWPHTTHTRSTTITGLTNNTEYEVGVRARNGRGNGFWSLRVRGTPVPPTPDAPSAPILIAADQKIIASWDQPASIGSDISDYDVRYCHTGCDSDSNWTAIADTTASTARRAVITGLDVPKTYQVQVRAENASGPGDWSASSTVALAVSPVPDRNLRPCDPAGLTQLWVDYGCLIKAGERGIREFDAVAIIGEGGDYLKEVDYRPHINVVELLAYNPNGGLATVETSLDGDVQDVVLIDVIRFGIRSHELTGTLRAQDYSYLTVRLHSPDHGSPNKLEADGASPARSWVQLNLPNQVVALDHNNLWSNSPIQVVEQYGDSVTFKLYATNAGSHTIGINAYRPAPEASCPTEDPLPPGTLRCFAPPIGSETQSYLVAETQSASALVAPPAPTTPPATPSSVSVTRADGTLTATWPAADRATSYHITYSSNGGVSWSLAGFNYQGTSITIDNAANSSTYIVGVRARNGGGGSGWRNSPPAGPYVPQPPATPSSVSVTRADGKLVAMWAAIDGATSYHITYSSNYGASWSLGAFDHPQNSITIDNVANSSTYIVGVRARNSAGGSGWRNSPTIGPYVP